MTTLSELFPQASSLPGGMTKDPRLLPCFDGTSSTSLYDSTSAQAASASGFWTELNLVGASATSSTDDTYTAVCDITGSGVLFHVVSQAITNTSDTVTFRITVDGAEYVIDKTQTWTFADQPQRRIVLGCCQATSTATKYTSGSVYFQDFAGDLASTQAFSKVGGVIYLTPPSEIMTSSLPCVRFEESLKVEVKVTDVSAVGTTPQYCGATYILD
jgi:hypothetical protein